MLGKIRASSSSLESLEEERQEHSKIIKHDSLSIYEATLAKLRQGAQRKLTEHEIKTDTDLRSSSGQPCEEVTVIDMHSSPSSVLTSSSEWILSSSSKDQCNKTTTVVSMFNRYMHCPSEKPDQTVTEANC